MKAYSLDLRERVVAAVAAGQSRQDGARRFAVGRSTVQRWVVQQATAGSLTPKQSPGRRRKIGRTDEPALNAQVGATPDATLAEHCAAWEAHRGVRVSVTTMHHALDRLGWRRKKKTLRAAEQDPVARAAYWEQTVFLDPARCVFLDETSTGLDFTRRDARAPHATRAVGTVPRNYGQRTSLLAVLTPDGLDAPLELEGALDTTTFVAYVEQFLRPTLKPGQVVILDNLRGHHALAAQELLESVGCTFHVLPSYSPDFNPIELAFSKVKAHLRKAAPRTQAALDTALLEAIDAITPTDARHWFRHAGYWLPASLAS